MYEAIPDDAPAPAVVNALVHRGHVTGEALPATVLDLATRGWWRLEQIEPGEVLCRLPRVEPDDLLARHERRVVTLLHDRAVGRTVPAGALTLGVEDEHTAWWERFEVEVQASGRDEGVFASLSPWQRLFVTVGIGFVLLALAAGLTIGSDAFRAVWFIVAVVIASALALVDITELTEVRFTRRGRAQRKWWRARANSLVDDHALMDVPPSGVAVWGRDLADAAALRRAPSATHGLPIGPDRTKSAWVRRGGMWQRVRLRYPRRFPPGWGRPPWIAAAIGLTGVAVSTALLVLAARAGRWHPAPPFSDDAARFLGDAEPIIASVAAIALMLAAWELGSAVLDAVRGPQTVVGTVVARRVRQGRRFNPWGDLVPRCWYIAVDDGMSRTIRGWQVTHEQFVTVRRGDRVEVRVGRALGNVDEIQRLT